MEHSIPLHDEDRAFDPKRDAARHDHTHGVRPDVAYRRLVLVNVVFYGNPKADDKHWVLIDAGVVGSTHAIIKAAEDRFGKNTRPSAIILTHGHADHVGVLLNLAEKWDVPIYAHDLEFPYLDGTAGYPPPDPSVGNGIMSLLSTLFPRGPIDASHWLHLLPNDHSVPGMPGWRWIHTPGHTPGHISLWRESDKTLIAGDAFITTTQESAYAVATQKPELHGPPMYFTQDWEASRASVQKLAALEPETVVTGHGQALHGGAMRRALHTLANEFDRIAIPEHGKYIHNPAKAETGTAYIHAPGR